MKFILKKEIPLLLLAFLPLIYLVLVWNALPPEIPIYTNADGIVVKHITKLVFSIFILSILLFGYAIVWFMQIFDKENKYKEMGRKFYQFRLILGLEMTACSLYFIYVNVAPEPNYDLALLIAGITWLLLGNIFQTIKIGHNLGYKASWTIYSEEIWNKTHRLAGMLCLLCGFITCSFYFLLIKNLGIIVFSMIGVALVLPFIYSYFLYKKEISII